MMKIGRNDPCPCGSGKKFKKCCMRENVVITSKELHYRRLSEAYDRLFERLGMHAEVVLDKPAAQAALREYLLLDPGIEPEEETLHRQMPLYLPWFLFNWEHEPPSGLKARGQGRTVADLYAEDKGHLLGDLERKIIDAVNRTPRRMVKTKAGSEAVEALLADAERGAGDAVTHAANLEGIRHVREILGLTK
jgi:hypothetical protein